MNGKSNDDDDIGLRARTVPGLKPSALDTMVESERRGHGKLRAAGFQAGVLCVSHDLKTVPTSPRRAAWEAEGRKWATDEMTRRAAAAAGKQEDQKDA
jgi:hypothetical protein